jgi:multiple sugar transport system substrate-binding protein
MPSQGRRDPAGKVDATPAVTKRGLLKPGATAAAGAAVLAACGPMQLGGDASKAKAPITLHWGFYNTEQVRSAVTKALPLFTQKNPHITVVQEPEGNSGLDYAVKLAAASAPDVFAACCHALPVWGWQGLLLNLDPFLKKASSEIPLSDYAQHLLRFWHTPQRGQFAMPMSGFTRALYYNRVRFQEKGIKFPDATWGWDQLRDAMVKLTEPDKNRFGWYMSADYERPGQFIRQNGGTMVDPKDNTRATWDSEQALAAVKWLHDRRWRDKAVPTAAQWTALRGNAQEHVVVIHGGVAMWTEGVWKLTGMARDLPEQAADWDIAVLPRGSVRRDAHASTDGWAIPAASTMQDGAWELMRWLQSNDWLESSMSIAGHQPARKSMLNRFIELVKQQYPGLRDKNLAAFTEPTKDDYAHPVELMKKHLDVRKVYDEMSAAVFERNEKPLEDSFRQAASQATAINRSS